MGIVVTFAINLTLALGVGGPVSALGGFTGAIIGLPVNVGIYVAGAYLGPEVDYVDEPFEEVREFDDDRLNVASREAVLNEYDFFSPGEND